MLLWNAVKLYFKEVLDYSFISLTWHYVESMFICWQDSINPHTIWNDVHRFLNAAESPRTAAQKHFNTTKLNKSVRKTVQAKNWELQKITNCQAEFQEMCWEVEHGQRRNLQHFEFQCRFGSRWLKLQNPALALAEDLLLSVLVVELDDECFSAQNLYLRRGCYSPTAIFPSLSRKTQKPNRLSGNLEVAHFQKEDQ